MKTSGNRLQKTTKRKSKCKRLLSGILCAALTITAFSGSSFAQPKQAEAKEVTLSNPRIVPDSSMVAKQKVTWDCVWFGSYPQAEVVPASEVYTALSESLIQTGDLIKDDALYQKLQSATGWNGQGDIAIDGEKYRRIKKDDATYSSTSTGYYNWKNATDYHYFKYQPIKWRILSVDGSEAFLLADKALDDRQYHYKYEDVTWEGCSMRSWLNGYSASANIQNQDYSSNNFLNTAFDTSAQSAIKETAVENKDNLSYGTDGGNDTKDKVFLLSESEVYTDVAKNYGFVSDYDTYDEARRAKSSVFAKAMGEESDISTSYEGNCWWRLRSPGYNGYYAAYVNSVGWVDRDNPYGYNKNIGMRPALNLNLNASSGALSSNLWSYAGTVCSDGTVEESGGDNNDSDNNTPSETPSGSDEKKLQCASSCTVEVGRTKSLSVTAYGSSLEELKTLTQKFIWQSDDTNVATVRGIGFLLPTSATKYSSENGIYETWLATGMVGVKGISEGSATITGTAADGSKVTCQVTVTEPEGVKNNVTDGNGGNLVLGEDSSGSGDSSAAEFFPANWSLKSCIFPVEVSKSEKEDGTYTVRGTVGIGKGDWLDDDAKWNKYKKNVSDAKKYTGRVDCLNNFKETWDVKSMTAVSTDKFETLPKLSVMGYFENTYDKNGNLISSTGKLAADAKWSGSISWQFVTPIGPLYLNLSGSGKISGNLGAEYNYADKSLKVADGSLKLTPSVSLEGGYGIDKVATIGAQGTLSVPITVVPASKGEFEAKAALHVKLVFVIDYTHDLATYKKTLWDTAKKKKGAKYSNIIRLSDGQLSEMDTSFAEMTGSWNNGAGKKKLKKLGEEISKTITLQKGILPSSLPMQVQFGKKRVMVFQSYDASRTTLNSSVLKYSVYENGIWSEPKAVLDDGYADMYADIKVVNNQLILVWQKVKKEITGNIETDSKKVLKEIAENSEICFSVFDGKTDSFQQPIHVTDNECYDMMPKICNDNSEIIVSWVQNDKADLMQETGSNTICMAKWNGSSFEKEEVLSQAPGTIDDYILYKDKDGIQSVFTGQSNGITAVFSTNGQVISGLLEHMEGAGEGAVSGLNYAGGKVNCISNGVLYSYDTSDGTVISKSAGESAFGSAVQYCSNGVKEGYIWSIYDEETGSGSIVASMATEDGYSEPITLCEKENVIWRYFSPVLDANGDWEIVANALDVSTDINSLLFVTKNAENRLKFGGASIDENDMSDGLTGVDYFVENTGDTKVEEMEVTVTLENGEKITKKVPIHLLPGESQAGTAYLDLSSVDKAQTVKVSAYAKNQSDISDSIVTDTVGLSDIAVKGQKKESGGVVTIAATLKNNSLADAKTILHLYGDAEETKELAASEEIMIKSNQDSKVTFTIKKKDLQYNENHAAYLTLKAEVAGGDYNLDNNVDFIVMYDTAAVSSPSPTVSPTVKPTTVPTTVPTVAPTPVLTETPEPTLKPTETPKATIKPSARPKPSTRPGTKDEDKTNSAKKIKKGSKVTDKKTKAVYKITGTGKNRTVEYTKSTRKNPSSISIPALVKLGGKNYKVTSVGKAAFKNNKKLKTVKLGKNVKKIGKQAFYGCTKLTNVSIGKNVASIGANAFNKCTALTIITIPSKVNKIGTKAFYQCRKLRYFMVKTKKLTLENIGENAFGSGYGSPRVKTDKKIWERYSNVFLLRGMSKKALFVIDPVKLVI